MTLGKIYPSTNHREAVRAYVETMEIGAKGSKGRYVADECGVTQCRKSSIDET